MILETPGRGFDWVWPRLAAAVAASCVATGLLGWLVSPWLRDARVTTTSASGTTLLVLSSVVFFLALTLAVAAALTRQRIRALEASLDEGARAKATLARRDALVRQTALHAAALVENHLRLDEAISHQLRSVATDTESAALTLIGHVGKLAPTSPAEEIADMLGQLQYQDVVRQRIERVASAVALRNALLEQLPKKLGDPEADLTELLAQMLSVLEDYLALEAQHAPPPTGAPGEAPGGLPQFELF